MSEQTIKEAWAWLDQRCGERIKLHKPSARALALAVLEEAERRYCRMGRRPSRLFRAQIEALGR